MKFLWFKKGHLLIQATGGTIDKLLLDFHAVFPCGSRQLIRLDKAYFIHWKWIFNQPIFSQVHTVFKVLRLVLWKIMELNHTLSLGGFLI